MSQWSGVREVRAARGRAILGLYHAKTEGGAYRVPCDPDEYFTISLDVIGDILHYLSVKGERTELLTDIAQAHHEIEVVSGEPWHRDGRDEC